jgi:hypothetical protein
MVLIGIALKQQHAACHDKKGVDKPLAVADKEVE